MDSSFQDLLKRLDHLSDQFRELKDGVHKAVLVADLDPEMALTRARKVLEHVVREVYERRCNEPPGTRPLENLIQRLVKDGHFPDRLDAYATTVRKLGNVGTHTFGEKITVQDVFQSLTQLMPILEWYFEVERPEALATKPPERQPIDAAPAQSVSPSAAVNIAVVPKGLRSFDAQDADFFLGLLPGARDKEGLPESIRFWKHRIEATDELTFTVGVIYGPSGCGKSSLVKAGLLPRLAAQIVPVYVEATAEDTEARLLKGLRKRCPGLPGELDLTGTVAALRQGQGLSKGQKVFVVLDQFEQWLHAARTGENSELVQALRQCDGDHVQCVVLVRDDFWMALTRFMQQMQIEMFQGQTCAAVDLFDLIHARNVLAAFGRAFGRLQQNPTKEQESFLDQAVQGLSQNDRVICVRLALFAEMVKGKPWTPATLKEVGGMEGVGVAFLEETFGASTAPPQHRLHQKAAQGVLKSLLPELGSDIKGHMRSKQELLEASGYGNRQDDFDNLIRILDGELRLITPTDPEGVDSVNGSNTKIVGQKYYQLTHDYLVPSLRDWLTRKQKETRRGRAELLLADRAAVWGARQENRQLPSLLQWFQIRWWTQKKNWTPPQRKMMRTATRHHAQRGLVVAIALALLAFGGYEGHGWLQAHALRDRLLDANTNEVPTIVRDVDSYRQWINPLLRDAAAQAEASKDARKQLHASLALLPVDFGQVEYLYGRLLDAEPQEVPVIRNALAPYKERLLEKLWTVVATPEKCQEGQRLRAAAALAQYDPESEMWAKASALVVNDLVLENAVYLGQWTEAFRFVKGHLVAPLSIIFRDHEPQRAAERQLATSLLADYAADQTDVIANLLMDADEKQFVAIYPKFKEQSERGLPILTAEIDKKLPPDVPPSDEGREKLAIRQANAAVALLKMNQPEKIWPLLKHTSDPRLRSYLIHRFGPLGTETGTIVKRMDEEPDITIRRALILSLGEYSDKNLSGDDRDVMTKKLQKIYCTAIDPGLHAASEWLLRHWNHDDWLRKTNGEWAEDKEEREKKIEAIKQTLAKEKEKTPPQWYVNGLGQTMVVIPGPVEFVMGSPLTEVGRQEYEPQHKKRIGRTFALAAKSVTVEQYREFNNNYQLPAIYTRTADLPVVGTSWYQAAAYCNWFSENEGIDPKEWCYEIKGDVTKMRENYLGLSGYRLPTEAEMEYATRAGAVTSRYFGETEELLPKYAWYTKNSQEKTWAVGSLKPNDLGLFDVQGNMYTWCQDWYLVYPVQTGEEACDDKEQKNVGTSRVLRGGSFSLPASFLRSANRISDAPSLRNDRLGFRVARTIAVPKSAR